MESICTAKAEIDKLLETGKFVFDTKCTDTGNDSSLGSTDAQIEYARGSLILERQFPVLLFYKG